MSADTTVQGSGSAGPGSSIGDLRRPDIAAAVARARRSHRNRRVHVWLLRLLLVVVVLAIWQLSTTFWLDPFFYSQPSAIAKKLYVWFTAGTSKGTIWHNMAITLEEAVLGFVSGALVGIVLGILLGRARLMAEVISPFIQMANAVPRIILAALFVIWFGIGLESKVATAFILVFFPVFFNSFQGAREVDRNLVNNARILGASKVDVLWSIVVPSATSWILASLHTAFGFALIGAIVGEYTGAEYGMGLLINQAQGTFDTAGIFAGMIIITVIALLAEALLGLLERKLLRWRPPSQSIDTAAV